MIARYLLLILSLLLTATPAHAVHIYWRSGLTGGGAGMLDAISKAAATPGVPLASGDAAVVIAAQTYYYTFDAASTAAESSPAIIAPDDAGASGRWLRVPVFLLAADVSGLATVATSGSYNDLVDKPNIPTAVSQLSNDIGYITGFTETDPTVNALGQATLTCTSGQIAKYNGSTWACAADTDTDTDIQWSGTAIGLTASTGRSSLGLGTAAVVNTGTGASDVILGNDTRLTDARTPTAHNQAWSTITSTPTTISGYGITDATQLSVDQTAAITGAATPGAGNVFATMGDIAAAGGGDMLKSIYDANSDNAIDDGAIPSTIARDSEIPTNNNQLTNGAGYLTGFTETDPTVNTLGQATLTCTSGQLAKFNGSTWACAADSGGAVDSVNTQTGSVNLTTDDVPEGTTNKYYTPSAAGDITATSVTADTITTGSFTMSPPPAGTTGEIAIPEDPANGSNVVGFKAPSSVSVDQLWTLPATDGTNGQTLATDGAGSLSWSTSGGGGDMLKSIYDANSDNAIDDGAIPSTIARDSEIPTNNNQLTNGAGYITGYSETDPTVNALGQATLTCATDQVAQWSGTAWICADMAAGPVDLTAPGPIGSVTPDTGTFTTLVATSFDWGTPPTGETGEILLLEDPTNGNNSVSFKAPASIAADVTWTLPATDGAADQGMVTNGSGGLSWITPLKMSNNLSELTGTASTARTNISAQASDADLDDLADGTLSGSKIGTGISATNVTTGTLPDAVIPEAIARDTEIATAVSDHAAVTSSVHGIADTSALAMIANTTAAPVTAPTTAIDTCTAGSWAYDASYVYICTAIDTWARAALTTW